MGCCLGVVGLAFPRIALVLMWLFNYTETAFQTRIWPLLGFFFLPFTTCAYAIAVNAFGGISGLGLVLLIIGVLLDFGSHTKGAQETARYRRVGVRRD